MKVVPSNYTCQVCDTVIPWKESICPFCATTYEYDEGDRPILTPELKAKIRSLLQAEKDKSA
jgi:hypothetical protein